MDQTERIIQLLTLRIAQNETQIAYLTAVIEAAQERERALEERIRALENQGQHSG
jgi:hypothetical protein